MPYLLPAKRMERDEISEEKMEGKITGREAKNKLS